MFGDSLNRRRDPVAQSSMSSTPVATAAIGMTIVHENEGSSLCSEEHRAITYADAQELV
jgi:hypothetical protein